MTLAAEGKKPRPSITFVVQGGPFIPSGDWMEDGWQPRENVEMYLGYHFTPFLALEGGFHHFKIYWQQTTPIYWDQNLHAEGVVLTPKLIYPLRRFELYLGASAAYYWVVNGVFVALPGAGYSENPDTNWGFHAVAGASCDLLRWLYLGLEGKYVILFNFLNSSNITGWALNISVGFRFL